MYLVDTNVWLERLLDREGSDSVGRFLDSVSPRQLWITDLALQSIGGLLGELDRMEVFLRFVQDVVMDGGAAIVSLQTEDIPRLSDVIQRFQLDFNDAYQYVAAEKLGLTVVSLDGDFDRTDRGRKTPAQAAGL